MRKINEAGVKLVKSFEGVEDGDPTTVNLDPYLCPAGVWTIGWGHAIIYNSKLLRGKSNKKLAYSLYPGGITFEEADVLLTNDLTSFSINVEKLLKVEVSDNQFAALTSFAYNVGIGNLKASTLLRKLNNSDIQGAADEFPKWRRANGVILNGLVRRRAAERALFLSK